MQDMLRELQNIEMPALAQKDHPFRERIANLENEMRKHDQLDLQVRHHFAPGVYVRELFIPKGTILTGKIHKHEHLNIISQGDITVITEEGNQRIKAPFTIISKIGTKRAGYAHEDTIWMTIHENPANETDLNKLEQLIIAADFCEIEPPDTVKQLAED